MTCSPPTLEVSLRNNSSILTQSSITTNRPPSCINRSLHRLCSVFLHILILITIRHLHSQILNNALKPPQPL